MSKNLNKSVGNKNGVKKSSKVKKNVGSKKDVLSKVDSKNFVSLEEAESFYHVSLLAQATCVVGVLFLTILAIFEHSFTVPIEVLIGITLLIMAFNNFKDFKRKGLTLIYVVFGFICLLVGVLGYFGVNV